MTCPPLSIADFDLKDLASTAIVVIMIIAGLVGQVLEQRKTGKKKADQRKAGPPIPQQPPARAVARPSPRPVSAQPSRPPAPKEQEDVMVIRLPNGQVIATVRKARPKVQTRERQPPPTRPAPPPRAKASRAEKARVADTGPPPMAPPGETQVRPAIQSRPGLEPTMVDRGGEDERPEPPKSADKPALPAKPARSLLNRPALRRAVIFSEVLQPPLALRDKPPGPPL